VAELRRGIGGEARCGNTTEALASKKGAAPHIAIGVADLSGGKSEFMDHAGAVEPVTVAVRPDLETRWSDAQQPPFEPVWNAALYRKRRHGGLLAQGLETAQISRRGDAVRQERRARRAKLAHQTIFSRKRNRARPRYRICRALAISGRLASSGKMEAGCTRGERTGLPAALRPSRARARPAVPSSWRRSGESRR
jgi:hypothetical protein